MKYFQEFTKRANLEFTPGDDWRQLKYLLRHKAYLMQPARQIGVPFGVAIKHDWAKFTPSEWSPYSDYWFTPGGKQDPKVRARFKKAWEHHTAHSPHHFAHSGRKEWDIPKHRLERVVDGYAAAKASAPAPKLFPTFKDWYLTRSSETKSRYPVKPVTDKYIRRRLA